MERYSHRPAMALVAAILGFMLAIAFNTNVRVSEVRSDRAADLSDVVRDLEHQQSVLQERLGELRARMATLQREAAEESGVRDSFTRELESAREIAGLSAVRGPGIEVVLGDAPKAAPGADPNNYLIHDTDITAVVNALFAGGAEAIDVNGERVVATTPIRCAGTTVLVNSRRVGAPYTVAAVGDQEAMAAALAEDPAVSLLVETYAVQYGLKVAVTKRSVLEVAAYQGTLGGDWARTAGGADL